MKSKRKPKKDLGGRPSLPPELRKVRLTIRVPRRIKDGFAARAEVQGMDADGRKRSSSSLEIEKAFDATEVAAMVTLPAKR